MLIERESVVQIVRRYKGRVLDEPTLSALEAELAEADAWGELIVRPEELGTMYSTECENICKVAEEFKKGARLRFFKHQG